VQVLLHCHFLIFLLLLIMCFLYFLYRVRRDKSGNLGIQIKSGSGGGLYVESVVPYGPAAVLGTVHRGELLLS
jgi:hypothetical protein